MSAAAAIGPDAGRFSRFFTATNGKKIVMAVSGLILWGFLIGHMAGNLQVFLGPKVFNHYAETLKSMPPLLWGTRITLLIAVGLHIWSAFALMRLKNAARPVGYVKKASVASTYASRTMYWSGPILLAFIIYHLMHFTIGIGGTPFEEGLAYENLVRGFQVIPVALFYLISMGLLCMHLYHGLWSMTQTLGFHHPQYTPKIRVAAKLIAFVLFVGFASIPVAVLAGVVKLDPGVATF